jgi:hypothetical protein
MKATLEFNLPDDQMEFNRVNQSLDMACALFDILQLRKGMNRRFESVDNTNNDVFDGIDAMADEIENIFQGHSIDIDRLIE